MESQELYTRKFTKLEMAYFTYNKILQRVVDFTLDVQYFGQRAKLHKKNSNEYNDMIAQQVNAQTALNNNELTLKVLAQQISNYEVEQKKNK